ncbi:MAG TPA: hypothetical protein PK322_12000 [Opitutaceae bacterium]|nr:hypothetical protein [Opitutaceae bacterium]
MHAGHGGVDGEVTALRGAAEDALEGGLEDAAIVGLAGAQRLLGALELGDVDDDALKGEEQADRVEDSLALFGDPDLAVGARGDPVVEPVGGAGREAALHLVPDGLALLRWNDVREQRLAAEEIVLLGDAEQIPATGADELDRPLPVVGATVRDAGEILHEGGPAALFLLQRLIGEHPVGDVLECACEMADLPVRVDLWPDARLKVARTADRGIGAVDEDLGLGRVDGGAERGGELFAVVGMDEAGVFRERRRGLCGLEVEEPEHLLRPVAVVGRDIQIPTSDAGVFLGGFETGFAAAQGLLGTLALGDIAAVQHDAVDGGVVQPIGAHRLEVHPRAVLVPHAVFDSQGDPRGGTGALQVGGGGDPIIGMDVVEAVAAESLRRREAEHGLDRTVDRAVDSGAVDHEEEVVGVAQQPLEPFLAVAQRLLGTLLFGHVASETEQADHQSLIGAEDWHEFGGEEAEALRCHQPLFDFDHAPSRHALPVLPDQGGRRLGREEVGRSLCAVAEGRHRQAQALDRLVDVLVDKASVGLDSHGEDHVAGVVERLAQAGLAAPDGGLGLLGGGDVHDRHRAGAVGVGGIDQGALQQYVDEGAVFAAVHCFDPRRRVEVGGLVECASDLLIRGVVGIEQPGAVADQFVGGVAEEFGVALVDAADDPVVDDGDAHRGGLEKAAHLQFALPQGSLRGVLGSQVRQLGLGAELLLARERGRRHRNLLVVEAEASDEKADEDDDDAAAKGEAEGVLKPVVGGGGAFGGLARSQGQPTGMPAKVGERVPTQACGVGEQQGPQAEEETGEERGEGEKQCGVGRDAPIGEDPEHHQVAEGHEHSAAEGERAAAPERGGDGGEQLQPVQPADRHRPEGRLVMAEADAQDDEAAEGGKPEAEAEDRIADFLGEGAAEPEMGGFEGGGHRVQCAGEGEGQRHVSESS